MLPQTGVIQATLAALLLQLVLGTDPLLTVLCREGFTEFARLLEGPAGASIRNACPRRIILFTPTNAAIARANSCSLSRRDDPPATAPDQYHCPADQAVPGPIVVKRRSTITTTPGAVALRNFLNDPQWVNLGPGQNSSVVQKNVPNAGLGTVLTGLGDIVKITGLDIPFECGVIRPISGRVLFSCTYNTFIKKVMLTGLGAQNLHPSAPPLRDAPRSRARQSAQRAAADGAAR